MIPDRFPRTGVVSGAFGAPCRLDTLWTAQQGGSARVTPSGALAIRDDNGAEFLANTGRLPCPNSSLFVLNGQSFWRQVYSPPQL